MSKKRMSINYITNSELYEHFKNWDKTKEIPKPIAEAIMLICKNLTYSGKFVRYTWRDEMEGDAILACVNGAKYFNHEKWNNPFAFLTTIAYNACRHRINIEHDRLATLNAYKRSNEDIYDQQENEDFSFVDNNVQNYDLNYTKEYVHSSEKKKIKQLKKDISKHYEDLFA